MRFKESLTAAQGSKQKMLPAHLKTLEKHIAAANTIIEAVSMRLNTDSVSFYFNDILHEV